MNILLIAYDNGMRVNYFPVNLAYLAGAWRNAGHNVSIWNQDICGWPDTDITAYLDTHPFDIVGLGFCAGYYQHKRAINLSRAVNASENRQSFRYILGGHGPAGAPEYFQELCGADYVCTGSGETIYSDTTSHPDNANPAYDLFPIEYYMTMAAPMSEAGDRSLPILTGRGCPYQCTFCQRLEKDFHLRSVQAVCDEMQMLYNRYGINYFLFADELMMVNRSRIYELCDGFQRLNVPNLKWRCNGRLNIGDHDMLECMRHAGCVFINYGVEALDDDVLAAMRKRLTVTQICHGVAETEKAGILMGLNIIWGNIGDTADTLEKGVKFLLDHPQPGHLRTIRPVTPYPGTELYQTAIERGMLKNAADFYRRHRNSDLATVQFTGMDNTKFHRALYMANLEIMRAYHTQTVKRTRKQLADLYLNENAEFRGFRQT